VPSFSYVSKFYVTLLLMLMAAVLFFLACLVRFCVRAYRDEGTSVKDSAPIGKQSMETDGMRRSVQDESAHPSPPLPLSDSSSQQLPGAETAAAAMATTDQDTVAQLAESTKSLSHRRRTSLVERVAHARSSRSPHWIDFSERLRHAMLILLCIFFLRICILEFNTFRCETLPMPPSEISSNAQQTEANYLSEDGITRCLSAEHIGLIVAAVILLVGFTLGYPIFVFVLLMRTFSDSTTQGVSGWLRRRIKLLRAEDGRVANDTPTSQARRTSVQSIEALLKERERTYGFLFMVRCFKTYPLDAPSSVLSFIADILRPRSFASVLVRLHRDIKRNISPLICKFFSCTHGMPVCRCSSSIVLHCCDCSSSD
jgi:hypothetical protein